MKLASRQVRRVHCKSCLLWIYRLGIDKSAIAR